MARLKDIRQRIHQTQFDSLVNGIGITTVQNNTALFGSANVGQKALTNLLVPGQIASDGIFVTKAIRAVMDFQSLADSDFGAFGSLTALNTSATGTSSRAEDLFPLMAYGANLSLTVGTKQQITAGLWYFPAGGGPSGQTQNNSRFVITNGVASQEAILKLAKDILISARQNFGATIEFFPFQRRGNGQAAAYAADLSPLDYLNQFDGRKLIQVHLDGILTRDVE